VKRALGVLVVALLASAFVGLQSVDSARAQSDAVAEPPVIAIVSPENKAYAQNNITLSFNVSIGSLNPLYEQPGFYSLVNIERVYFQGSWQQNRTYVDQHNNVYAELKDIRSPCKSLTFSCNLTGVPEGYHNITVYATETQVIYNLPFVGSTSFSSVNFSVDTVSPSILVFTPEAETYAAAEVPLEFSVNEPFSKIAYSLDGSANVTVAGNVTLSGLAGGGHTVTVYAWDEAGNLGASAPITFTVTAFPTALVIAAVLVAVVVCAGLLLYFAKFKRRSGPT
jgi:hypothetical protein